MSKCAKKLTLRVVACLAALLLSCCLLFGWQKNGAWALTLERPNVNVDWNKVPAPQQKKAALVYAPNRLFGTVEFRSPLKNLAQWERILRLYSNRKNIDDDFHKPGGPSDRDKWEKLKSSVKGMKPVPLLQEVNKFFNLWPYRSDMDVHGLMDYWATPGEFINKSGDCEDFAIAKFFALIQFGINPDNMRIVVLKDSIRNIHHAVLAVYVDKEVYILDNNSPLVLSHSKYGHYQPLLSVNLKYRWAHVPPSK